jgi:hypothetical protein
VEQRYDAGELARAAEIADGSPHFQVVKDAILAIKRVLIDNGAYPFPTR